jgi:transcriptional regulator with XRE-family HTH domain
VVYKQVMRPMRYRYDRHALRRLRVARGLDITTLAARSRFSKQAISMLDRGAVEPRASTLARLAIALDVAVGEFFIGPDAPVRVS